MESVTMGTQQNRNQIQPGQPFHQMDTDEDDETVKQLQECSVHYLALQDCLVENNRSWKSCQNVVQALKACNEKRNIKKGS
ncbi:unnamed protein product [Cuscuta campestris]|uniref:CHCH domain-containing protein n=1 Tax=Cuscuta campestris TaxID=132261 RepID=A0A484KIP2_9ASTE|nr:unnamed protein product [Cuscuta campestris]